jgi:hypothetical protein
MAPPEGLVLGGPSTALCLRGRGQFAGWLSPVCPSFASWTGPASRSMARAMIAPTYIRQLRSGLPTCCMHGLIAREDGAHLLNGRFDNAKSATPWYSHTSDPPNTPEGASEPLVLYLAIEVTDW